jgi:phosphoadenosine phosphosulfate reductase
MAAGARLSGMVTPLRLVRPEDLLDLDEVNRELASASPAVVVAWAAAAFGEDLILTSSFGAESAVMLHLVSQVIPKIRVVFLDTGFLFPETYQFAEELTRRLDLDVRVYSPQVTSARLEALYGKLWEGDQAAIECYQYMTKVEPMDRAVRELAPAAWIAGLRGGQTAHRSRLRTVEFQDGIYKVHPILGWNEELVHDYLRSNDLPYHPLHARGYRSIGDVHSTSPVIDGQDARSGRRLGVHSECGIHLPRDTQDASLKSSAL